MQMHFPVYVFSLLLVLSGCVREERRNDGDPPRQSKAEIEGVLEGGSGKTLILEEMKAREFVPVDTVVVDESDGFRISFILQDIAFYILRTGGKGYITLLIRPGEELQIRGSYGETFPYSVRGSEGSELLQKLAAEHSRVLDELAEIVRQNRELSRSPDFPDIKQKLDRKFDSITGSFREYSLDFIHRNPGSLSILVALHNLYGDGLPVFRPDSDFEVYSFVDSVLMENYGDFESVRLLHARIEEVRHAFTQTPATNRIQSGNIAPDFVSSQPDGSKLALSDLEGNYVLLSFWAGWSNLSRDENRFLKIAYQRYREESFRILQVSLDEKWEVWTDAIREEGLGDWYHVSDLKRWESIVADLYYLEKIPSNVLLDPGGRIVATDLFGNVLLERLDQIFSGY